MEGKTALITGGSFGIGQATAIAFAKQGANVVVADWIEDKEQETIKQISACGGKGIFIKCDVSKPDQVSAMISKFLAEKDFDAYVRNADNYTPRS